MGRAMRVAAAAEAARRADEPGTLAGEDECPHGESPGVAAAPRRRPGREPGACAEVESRPADLPGRAARDCPGEVGECQERSREKHRPEAARAERGGQ